MTKPLTAQQITLNLVSLVQQAADPSVGGVASAIGSLYLRSGTGQMWLKTGAADINWQRLVQSFAWYVVKDYGAKGDDATDDTAAIQAAIDACSAAGGGKVFFPPGIYRVTQLSLAGKTAVQLEGSGPSSVVRWTWNAATVAGSMITVSAGSTKIRIANLQLSGAGLTNPAASRENHLISVVGAGGGVTTLHVQQCVFTAMVAASGDGVHAVGTAGNLVSRLWVSDNVFDGCSRYSVGVEQGLQFAFITQNYMTNCTTEIAFIGNANVTTNAVTVFGNHLIHAGATRHALRLEGNATALITRLTCGENVILGGFVTNSNIQWASFLGNVVTSGAFASTDGVWRMFDSVSYTVFAGSNLLDRDSGASAGPCMEIEKATTAPTMVRVGANILINEKSGNFVTITDATKISVGNNLCHSTDAGTSTDFGIDVQAVTVDMTDVLIGPGNQMTSSANSLLAGVRLLANGANMTDCSVVSNQGDTMDYGVQFEIGGGGGIFNGQVLYSGNNFASTVGDIHNVGVTVRPRIGFNASLLGANLFSGTGTPEATVTARIGSIYLRTDGGPGTAAYYKESGTGNTGWIAFGGSEIIFGADSVGLGAAAAYLAPGYIAVASATEIKITITRPGILRNLRVQVATAGTDVGVTNAYTVRKNGVDTTLTCSILNATNGPASDTTHTVAVVAGDLVSISVVKDGAATLGQAGVTAVVELV